LIDLIETWGILIFIWLRLSLVRIRAISTYCLLEGFMEPAISKEASQEMRTPPFAPSERRLLALPGKPQLV